MSSISKVCAACLFLLCLIPVTLADKGTKYEVTITNLTGGQMLSPPVVVPSGWAKLAFDTISYDEGGSCLASGEFDAKDVGITLDGGVTYDRFDQGDQHLHDHFHHPARVVGIAGAVGHGEPEPITPLAQGGTE